MLFSFIKFIHIKQQRYSRYSGFSRTLISFRPKASFQIKQTKYLGFGAVGRRTLIAGSRCLFGSFFCLLILSLAIASILRCYIFTSGFSVQTAAGRHPPPAAVVKKKKKFSADYISSGPLYLSLIVNQCASLLCSHVFGGNKLTYQFQQMR